MDYEAHKVNPELIEKQQPDKAAKLDKNDLLYMSSLSAAVLQKTPTNTRFILWVGFAFFTWLLIWASIAEIDELTRGTGKVVPSNQVQVIQNLEGGIVSEILVKEGDTVTTGQVLLKLEDVNFASSLQEERLRFDELQAKSIRLQAESLNKSFVVPKELKKRIPKLIKKEQSLYRSNLAQFESKLHSVKEKRKQKENELFEIRAKLKKQLQNKELYQRELNLTQPLVDEGLVSKVEFLQLKRKMLEIETEIESATLSIPRLESMIEESADKISETRLEFQNKAKLEWNEVSAEMQRLAQKSEALADRVKRTLVRSSVNGTVKRLLINTVSGVVQPGMDILEIVPSQDTLLIETKIKPQDIAFLYAGQETMVKFTAYDFAIHGGLKGKVVHISADTILDDEGKSFYTVNVKTEKTYLGSDDAPLEVIVGMTAEVDILTGKKTVLDYILKPILKAKHSALTER